MSASVASVLHDEDDLQLTEEELEDLVVVHTEKSHRFQKRRRTRKRLISIMLAFLFVLIVVGTGFRKSGRSSNHVRAKDKKHSHPVKPSDTTNTNAKPADESTVAPSPATNDDKHSPAPITLTPTTMAPSVQAKAHSQSQSEPNSERESPSLVPATESPTPSPPTDQPTVMVGTTSNNDGSEASSVDWYDSHVERGKQIRQELIEWKQQNAGRIITLNEKEEQVPELDELANEFKALLPSWRLLFIGDSTARVLFVALWCLMEDIEPGTAECRERQKEAKAHCQNTTIDDDNACDGTALFRNGFDGTLEYAHRYHLSGTESANLTARFPDIRTNTNRSIFVGMPCLHCLWSPGGRETDVTTTYPQWSEQFQAMYGELDTVLPPRRWSIGTPVTMVDDQLGDDGTLIDWYLHGQWFNASDSESANLIRRYNYNTDDRFVPNNYTGPIEPLVEGRADHAWDDALFDDTGGKACALHGLRAAPTDQWIVDIGQATADCPDDSRDGRHYAMGLALRRQLVLLLRMMKKHQEEATPIDVQEQGGGNEDDKQ